MAAGYIYVLVNSSMPGLLKVGKTTRTTSERCAELASATGVPTPFVVAFEQYFHDCDAAEQAVHAALTHAGLRQADNREFFRGSPNEVIRIILATPDISPASTAAVTDSGAPWKGVFAEAQSLEPGSPNIFADAEEAKRLYTVAAQLGAPQGYRMAGRVAAWKNPPDVHSAMALYKKGAQQGDYGCYAGIASLFEEQGRMWEALQAWELFFQKREAGFDDRFEGPASFYHLVAVHVRLCVLLGAQPVLLDRLRLDAPLREAVYEEIVSMNFGAHDSGGVPDVRSQSWLSAQAWMREHVVTAEEAGGNAPSTGLSRAKDWFTNAVREVLGG